MLEGYLDLKNVADCFCRVVNAEETFVQQKMIRS